MSQLAKQKGLDILTAADWTHPLWFKEISLLLEESQEGMYTLKSEQNDVKKTQFILSTEISSIYKQGDKLRRIHNLVFAPNLETADKISKELLRRGCNLSADGRPIIGLSSKQLLQMILDIDERCMLIPCHVWTPHFGIYGSASGFDSLEEAFEELAPHIYGIETGLSSDPEMNWQIKELHARSILSFSDAHSPAKMGREATVLVTKDENDTAPVTYEDIRSAFMRKNEKLRIGYTIEFYPEEGKYHFSGHRNCKVVFGPEDIKSKGNTCPVCKRRLTEGVLYRLQQLANQTSTVGIKHNEQRLKWYVDNAKQHPPFVKLVPLLEIVAESMEATVASQKVKDKFAEVCRVFGSEINVLLKTSVKDIEKLFGERLAEGVEKVRAGTIAIDPGYDGEYGKVAIWGPEEIMHKLKTTPVNQLGFDL